MGVDWQAFATAFLNGTALNIKERKDDADEYKDELTEKAEDNKALLSTRKSAAQAAYQHILTAKELGADDRTIKAALRAGPQGITTLTTKLIQAKEAFEREAPGVEWTPQDVSARAAVPEGWKSESDEATTEYYKKLTDQLYGLGGGTAGDYKSKASRSWLENAMGFNAKDRIREELDIDVGAGGFSTYDLSKLDTTPSYTAGDFATVVTYSNPVVFGLRSRENEIKNLDSIRRTRIEESGGFVDLTNQQIETIARKLKNPSAYFAEEGLTDMAKPGSMENFVASKEKEILTLQQKIKSHKNNIYYQHFVTQVQAYPDDAQHRKLGYLINMDDVIKEKLSDIQYIQLRENYGLNADKEKNELKNKMVTQEGNKVFTKTADGEILSVTNVGRVEGSEDYRTSLLPNERTDAGLERNPSYAFGPGIDNYTDFKLSESANTALGDRIKNTQIAGGGGDSSVNETGLNNNLAAFESKGNITTFVTKENEIVTFNMAVKKLSDAEGALTDMTGEAASLPISASIQLEGAKTIEYTNPEKVAILWNKVITDTLQLEKNVAQSAGIPYSVNEIVPFTRDRIKNLVFIQPDLAEVQRYSYFQENPVGRTSFLGGMSLEEAFPGTLLGSLTELFKKRDPKQVARTVLVRKMAEERNKLPTDRNKKMAEIRRLAEEADKYSSIIVPLEYNPTSQSVTDDDVKIAASKLKEQTIAASKMENETLIDIIEFWKEIQRQNEDPAERKEQLNQFLENYSDPQGQLTIKAEDVMPLLTEEYDRKAMPVIKRLEELFSMSAGAATNPALNTNITEDKTVIAPSFQKPEKPGPDNAPIISDRQGLGAKPETKAEVVEEGSTDPFVMEHIDDLVALAKGRNNVSSKKSLENIEKGRLGQWNTLIETWARKNDIELPDKIADRKALLSELADEYIRIMKSE